MAGRHTMDQSVVAQLQQLQQLKDACVIDQTIGAGPSHPSRFLVQCRTAVQRRCGARRPGRAADARGHDGGDRRGGAHAGGAGLGWRQAVASIIPPAMAGDGHHAADEAKDAVADAGAVRPTSSRMFG